MTSVGDLSDGPLPQERAAGLTSEVPSGLRAAVAALPSGHLTSPVRILLFGPADPLQLSDRATQQVACTAIAALAAGGIDPVPAVVLSDPAHRQRGPLRCTVPITGS